jgi:DNA polymerase beta
MILKKSKKSYKSSSNARIINILETVKSYYAREQNTIHVSAYERAIYQLKKWPHPIKMGNDVAHLEGIGKGMIQKIDIILATGTLPIIQEKGLTLVHNTNNTKKFLFKEFPISQVLGFSAKSALELEKHYGIRSVKELKELLKNEKIEIKLSRLQKMGLRYHNDLQEKIPRDEITSIGHKIEKILQLDGIMVFLAGSYPSELKKESKDIDILLVVRDSNRLKSKSKSNFYLEELVRKLKKEIPLETITIGANKFLGIVKLNTTDKWRHLDMRLVDMHVFPYSWLYYSSGVVFNKIIREKLKKKGYKLNEWGLFKNNEKVSLEGEKSLEGLEKENATGTENLLAYSEKIEKEIFKLAQLEYKTIQERY